MVSVCLPSDTLLQYLPSYLGFSYLGRGVSLHGCSSKAQSLLRTLDEGYLLTTNLPDLHHGIASLGPLLPAQPPLLGRGVAPLIYDLALQVMLKNKQLKKKKKKKKYLIYLSRSTLSPPPHIFCSSVLELL